MPLAVTREIIVTCAIAALIALAGCLEVPDAPQAVGEGGVVATEDAISVETLAEATEPEGEDGPVPDDPAEEAGAEGTTAEEPATEEPPAPTAEELAAEACRADGGDPGRSPSGQAVCYRTPKDANKHCTRSTQCSTVCLARSQTCSPLMPLFGCYDIFSATGAIQNYCRE